MQIILSNYFTLTDSKYTAWKRKYAGVAYWRKIVAQQVEEEKFPNGVKAKTNNFFYSLSFRFRSFLCPQQPHHSRELFDLENFSF
jgi:hypothetical protein